jgi:hypothetical protein
MKIKIAILIIVAKSQAILIQIFMLIWLDIVAWWGKTVTDF